MTRARGAWLALLMGLATSACGSSGSSGDAMPGGGGGTGGGSDGSGDGDGAGAGACLAPASLERVLEPMSLSDGSVIYRMALDGDHLYFASIDTLYRVPVAGGEAQTLWHKDLTTAVPFFVRASDIVIMDGQKLLKMPKSGGTTTELVTLPDVPSGALDGRVDLLVEGDQAYMKHVELGSAQDDPPVVSFYAIDLNDGSSSMLTSTAFGRFSPMVKADDALWIAERDPSLPPPAANDNSPQPDVLYRVPLAGGEPALVRPSFEGGLSLSFNPLGADSTAVFVAATVVSAGDDAVSALDKSGIYRVPLSGGTSKQLVKALALFNATQEHDLRGDENFLRVIASGDQVYSSQVGSDTAKKRFCIQDGEAHAMAIGADTAYVALFDDMDRSYIVRVTL